MRGLKQRGLNRKPLFVELSFNLGTTDPETANRRMSILEAAIPWDTLKRHDINYEIAEILDKEGNKY